MDYQLNLGTFYSQVHLILHVSLFKPFCAGGDGYLYLIAMYIEDEQEWEVSVILQYKGSCRRMKYLVAYSGHNKSEACWLPESELFSALDIINDYKVTYLLN